MHALYTKIFCVFPLFFTAHKSSVKIGQYVSGVESKFVFNWILIHRLGLNNIIQNITQRPTRIN